MSQKVVQVSFVQFESVGYQGSSTQAPPEEVVHTVAHLICRLFVLCFGFQHARFGGFDLFPGAPTIRALHFRTHLLPVLFTLLLGHPLIERTLIQFAIVLTGFTAFAQDSVLVLAYLALVSSLHLLYHAAKLFPGFLGFSDGVHSESCNRRRSSIGHVGSFVGQGIVYGFLYLVVNFSAQSAQFCVLFFQALVYFTLGLA